MKQDVKVSEDGLMRVGRHGQFLDVAVGELDQAREYGR